MGLTDLQDLRGGVVVQLTHPGRLRSHLGYQSSNGFGPTWPDSTYKSKIEVNPFSDRFRILKALNSFSTSNLVKMSSLRGVKFRKNRLSKDKASTEAFRRDNSTMNGS